MIELVNFGSADTSCILFYFIMFVEMLNFNFTTKQVSNKTKVDISDDLLLMNDGNVNISHHILIL